MNTVENTQLYPFGIFNKSHGVIHCSQRKCGKLKMITLLKT